MNGKAKQYPEFDESSESAQLAWDYLEKRQQEREKQVAEGRKQVTDTIEESES
jgi:hypothetical protein